MELRVVRHGVDPNTTGSAIRAINDRVVDCAIVRASGEAGSEAHYLVKVNRRSPNARLLREAANDKRLQIRMEYHDPEGARHSLIGQVLGLSKQHLRVWACTKALILASGAASAIGAGIVLIVAGADGGTVGMFPGYLTALTGLGTLLAGAKEFWRQLNPDPQVTIAELSTEAVSQDARVLCIEPMSSDAPDAIAAATPLPSA
jgi:hypothetical protein